MGSEKGVGLEITANQPVTTDTRVLTGPDRVVIDFPGAVPGNELKGFPVKRGPMRAVRVGLFTSNPPTTRVVLDLNAPTPYEILPAGNTVIVKMREGPTVLPAEAVEHATVAPVRATLPAPRQQSPRTATIKRVAILGSEKAMELEITASQPVATDTRMLTSPDRVVIDFPGAVPGAQLKGFTVNHGAIRAVRAGLLSSNPPTTRVVLDLNAPSPYQVFPSGNVVMVKLGGAPSLIPAVVIERHPVTSAPVAPPAPRVQVSFQDGLLSIEADKANLAEVLNEVHLRTGADIPIPAGAEQEQVIVKAGPGPATEVMATLLNGSHFNFVVVGAAEDQNALRKVILTPKNGDISQPDFPSSPPPPVTEEVPSEVPPPVQENSQPGNPPAPSMPQNPMPPDQNAPPEQPPQPPQY
ncbi:MAG TPA: AMIN domain-containing protein [Terriglobales bacterium]|nr:AMIN domain-containing protein [Terriglobales bacterium]